MKIGIDTFGCDHGRSGFGSYVLYFISNLPPDLVNLHKKATTINADVKNETIEASLKDKIQVELFGIEEDRYTYTSGKTLNFVSTPMIEGLAAERLWHKTKIYKFIKKQGYDAVIYPAIGRVLPGKFKHHIGVAIANSIVSADLQDEKKSYRRHLLKSLKNIQFIIAASEYIKNDLVSLGIASDKITVIHNGIDHKLFYPMLNLDNEIIDIKPFAIKRPYFVYGSSLTSPEKKHIELIHAFEKFKKSTGLPHRLVLAGNNGPYAQEIHKVVFNSEYASDIFLVGFFPHENFARLYSGSDACLFPSVNEGVGLPILEAMATGIPVLCSDKGALKEIGGNAPLYFNSDNIEEIAADMQKIVQDKELHNYLVKKSIPWAQNYNWEDTVKKTLNLFIR